MQMQKWGTHIHDSTSKGNIAALTFLIVLFSFKNAHKKNYKETLLQPGHDRYASCVHGFVAQYKWKSEAHIT